jgi:hypothetical protein
MIRPLPAPRFTGQARSALIRLAESFAGSDPVVLVEALGSEHGLPQVRLQFIEGSGPLEAGQVQREDVPFPVRFMSDVGLRLMEYVIDAKEEEGGLRSFLVRTAEPSGSRAFGPPSTALASFASSAAPSGGSTFPSLYGDDAERGPVLPAEELSRITDILSREIRARIRPLVAGCGGAVQLIRLRSDAVAEIALRVGSGPECLPEGSVLEVLNRVLCRAFPLLQGIESVPFPSEGMALWPSGGAPA